MNARFVEPRWVAHRVVTMSARARQRQFTASVRVSAASAARDAHPRAVLNLVPACAVINGSGWQLLRNVHLGLWKVR
jgi:hypothetical protein